MVVATPAASRLPDGGRFVALDSWRGIAALAVVAFRVHESGLALSWAIASHGWMAVDFFFVLSGFVISAAYGARLSNGFSIRRFMLLRLGRIYPLHVFVLAMYVAAELARIGLLLAGLPVHAPFSGASNPGDLLLSVLFLQVFTNPTRLGWTPASWSIAVEIWLYLLAALTWRAFGRVAWLAAAIVSVAALILLTGPFEGWSARINSDLVRGVAGFGLGMVCWAAWDRGGLGARWAQMPARHALALEILALAVVITALALSLPLPLVELAFAFLILAFAADRGAVSRLLATAMFVWIGVLSFSIYLVHLLVLLAVKFALHALITTGSPALPAIAGVGVFLVTIAVAWITWRFVEAPARDWSRRRASAMGAGREETVAPTI